MKPMDEYPSFKRWIEGEITMSQISPDRRKAVEILIRLQMRYNEKGLYFDGLDTMKACPSNWEMV